MTPRVLLCSALLFLGCEDEGPPGPDLSVNGATIPCQRDADCPATLPACHMDSHVCVGCISSFQTCGPGLTCDEATHRCVTADPSAPCTRNADCPRPGFDPLSAVTCEVDAGMCVECAGDADCVSANGGLGVCLPDKTCQKDGGT